MRYAANPCHEEPDASIAHVRICGGRGRVTALGYPTGLGPHNYFTSQDWKAVQVCKLIRPKGKWEIQDGGVHGSVFLPLVKALVWERAKIRNRNVRLIQNNRSWAHVVLFFPVVVLASDIYYVDSMATPPTPVKMPHVSYVHEIESQAITGTFRVDFVTRAELRGFVEDTVGPFVDHVAMLVEKEPELLRIQHVSLPRDPA